MMTQMKHLRLIKKFIAASNTEAQLDICRDMVIGFMQDFGGIDDEDDARVELDLRADISKKRAELAPRKRRILYGEGIESPDEMGDVHTMD